MDWILPRLFCKSTTRAANWFTKSSWDSVSPSSSEIVCKSCSHRYEIKMGIYLKTQPWPKNILHFWNFHSVAFRATEIGKLLGVTFWQLIPTSLTWPGYMDRSTISDWCLAGSEEQFDCSFEGRGLKCISLQLYQFNSVHINCYCCQNGWQDVLHINYFVWSKNLNCPTVLVGIRNSILKVLRGLRVLTAKIQHMITSVNWCTLHVLYLEDP